MDRDLRKRFQFFLEYAGYRVPPGRAACALELARIERLLEEAQDLDLATVTWTDDDTPYDPGDGYTDEESARLFESNEWTGPFGCIVAVGDDQKPREIASLWGIVVGPRNLDDPYCRVVAAELASELEDELRQAIGDARDAVRAPSGICHFPAGLPA